MTSIRLEQGTLVVSRLGVVPFKQVFEDESDEDGRHTEP